MHQYCREEGKSERETYAEMSGARALAVGFGVPRISARNEVAAGSDQSMVALMVSVSVWSYQTCMRRESGGKGERLEGGGKWTVTVGASMDKSVRPVGVVRVLS